MPIYEYICSDCQRRFEHFFINRRENQDVVCSYCGGRKVQRIFSTFAMGGKESSSETSSDSCHTCSTKTCNTCH